MATEARDPTGPGGTTSGGTRAGDRAARAGGRSEGGRGSLLGGSGDGFGAAADQRQRNRLSEVARIGGATGLSTSPSGNTGVSPAGRATAVTQGMARDFRDVGNTPIQNALNAIGRLVGLREQPPSPAIAAQRVAATPAGQITNRTAELAFDPVGAIGSLIGAGVGMPFGPGIVAGLISEALGRPLEISMGPSSVMPGTVAPQGVGAPAGPTTLGSPGSAGMLAAGINPILQALLAPPVAPRPITPPIAPPRPIPAPVATARGLTG